MENLPEFGDPNAPPTEPPSPKKPRRKPVKKTAKIAAPKPMKRRKRRTIKPAEQHHGGRYPSEVYRLIGSLMNLDIPLRNFVMEVAKALTK